MESVGQILRDARLRAGLTLQDVNACTRISVNSLMAIEADRLDQISSRFLFKSFVRQIAQSLKCDGPALELQLAAAVESMPEALVPGQPGSPMPPRLQSLRPQQVRVSRWVSSLALLMLMLVACSTLYAMWQNSRSRDQGTPIHAALLQPKPVVAERAVSTSAAPPALAGQPTAPFHLQLSALEQTWLSVVADGKEVYSGILRTAETKTLEGYETARIRTGNAGGVDVIFNGRNLGALGSRGQVRTVVFNRNGYEIREPQDRLSLTSYELRIGG